MTGVTDGEPCEVETRSGTVRARDVIVAAHVPANNWAALITKLPAYRTYAIGARGAAPIPPGLYWDTDDPYHYTRTQPADEGDVLIIGGEDHKTGTESETLHRSSSTRNRTSEWSRPITAGRARSSSRLTACRSSA